MAVSGGSRKRERAHVRVRGGSHQVVVYAGVDPVTGKDSYITESTRDEKKVAEIRTRLLAKVDQQRNAATRATLSYTISAWLDVHEGEESTLKTYRGYIDRTISPALGDVPISKLRAQTLEKFYAQLRRCSVRCEGTPRVDHRTSKEHECRVVRHRRKPGRPAANWEAEHDCAAAGCAVVECKPHVCKPMARSSIRQVHAIISGALDTAVRWDWIPSNPATVAKTPKQSPPQPKPPTPAQAAQIVAAAWDQDADWGMLVWLAMATGARRGELLALQWLDVHFDAAVLEFRRTKTHQMRRIALDPVTVDLLAAQRLRYENRVQELGVPAGETAYVFSYQPDHSRPCNADGVTHRFERLCKSVGVDSHLHAFRHYSATELVSAGVDVRTIAGRLGHGGGGTTTLRVYAAWVAESDKRAAGLVSGRMARPIQKPDGKV